MNHEHPSEQGSDRPSEHAPSALAAWVVAAIDHWKASLVVALVAGAAVFAADNPMRRSSQVGFLVAAAPGASDAHGGTGDIARILSNATVPDAGRGAAVTAKSERDTDMVSVSFTVPEELDERSAATLADSLVDFAKAALAPQLEGEKRSITQMMGIRRDSLARVGQMLGGAAGGAPPTEAVALLMQQQAELTAAIAEDQRRLEQLTGPVIVGPVSVKAGRSASRAWAAPVAAFALAFFAAPLVLRSLSEAHRAAAAARRP